MQSLFAAQTREEAEQLADRVMDAELDVVCPHDDAPLQVCGHCGGTAVNPDVDPSGPTRVPGSDATGGGGDDDGVWAPGLACAVCAASEHPGYERVCVRDHTMGATFHVDGQWRTSDDRRTLTKLDALERVLAHDGPDAALAVVRAWRDEISGDDIP